MCAQPATDAPWPFLGTPFVAGRELITLIVMLETGHYLPLRVYVCESIDVDSRSLSLVNFLSR